MSYDVLAYIRYEKRADLNEQIVAYFKTYGFDVELYHDFDLATDGAVALIIRKSSKFWENIARKIDFDIYLYVEMIFSEIDHEVREELGISTRHSHDLIIFCNCDSCEVWLLFGAAIAVIFQGIVDDPQEGRGYLLRKVK